MVSAAARIKAVRETALRRAEQAPQPVLRIAATFLREMTGIEPFDRAMTLAAQAFTSFFPLLITVATFIDRGGDVAEGIATSLSLPDAARAALDRALPADTGQATALGVISVLIVLLSATSFSRALGRMYAKAWHEPHAGWLDGWRWIIVILAISAATVATKVLNADAEGLAGHATALTLTFVLNTLLWTTVPALLLAGHISVFRLLPAAALMGVGSVLLAIASRIYMPYALQIGAVHFGALGIAFTLIGWLFVVGFVLIIATVFGAVVVHDEGVEHLVRRLRERRR